MEYQGMVITDLDGTLLKNNRQFCENDLMTLYALEEKKFCRTIATGRSLFSLRKVIYNDFPIDYIIFSSGAGVINWHTKEIFFKQNIPVQAFKAAIELLHELQIDFMLHWPIPENHKFIYYAYNKDNIDFFSRIELYKDHADNGEHTQPQMQEACQLLAITDDYRYHKLIQEKLPQLKVIRATSPLNHSSTWIEIFHPAVSKGFTSIWLCNQLGIPAEKTLGIGNDYNDFDLLEKTNHSFVVANAPKELHERYNSTFSNDENGFSKAVRSTFQL